MYYYLTTWLVITNHHQKEVEFPTNDIMSKSFQEVLTTQVSALNDKTENVSNRISIEDIVDTRVISQDGFISVPLPHAPPPTKTTTKTVTQSSSEPSITHVKRMIDSLQNEINALKQRQQATDETIRNNPLHELFEKQNSQVHALDIKMSQYMKDEYQRHVDLQTSIQDKCKAEWNNIWSIQRREFQTQNEQQLSEVVQQGKLERQSDMQTLHNQIYQQLRQEIQEMHQYADTQISTVTSQWKEIDQTIQQQNQNILNQWHTQWVSELKLWWEQETVTLHQSFKQQVHAQIQEEQNQWKKTLMKQQQQQQSQHQPNFTYDSIFLQYQNNLMQKMEDRLHKHLQHVSNQYQTLENIWKKKLDYMNDRCSLLEKHLLQTPYNNHSYPTMNACHIPQQQQQDNATNNINNSRKNDISSSTSSSCFPNPKSPELDTTSSLPTHTSDGIKVECYEPQHSSEQDAFTCSTSDDEVETIKVVRPPPQQQPSPAATSSSTTGFTEPIQYPPEKRRTKRNTDTSTKDSSTTSGKDANDSSFNNPSWFQEPPQKKGSNSKETSMKNSNVIGGLGVGGSYKATTQTFNFHLNQKSALEEQERLLRESAARVRAQQQQEEARKKKSIRGANDNYTFVEPVEDLTKLPINHWKFTDMYARLGLPPKASDELVKKHYRKLCLFYHPDKNVLNGDDNADRFQGVKVRYASFFPQKRPW